MADMTVTVQGDGDLPDGLLAAVTGYEDALAADDLTRLSRYFEDDGVRADAAGVLVGRAQIDDFRGEIGRAHV